MPAILKSISGCMLLMKVATCDEVTSSLLLVMSSVLALLCVRFELCLSFCLIHFFVLRQGKDEDQ